MIEWVTLERQHPDFMKYLWGTFSETHRALPVKSLNVRTDQEAVTFRLVPLSQVARPSWLIVWMKALRPRRFLQILVPLFLVLCLSERLDLILDPDLPWIAIIGLLFLFASLLFANDVNDHLSGEDRVHPGRGSRAIQNGWLRALTLKRASWISLGIAALFAIPLVLAVPRTLVILIPALLLGVWGFYRSPESFKEPISGAIALFLLSGPLLVVGFQVAVTGGFDLDGLILGSLWGWFVLYQRYLHSLECLVSEGRVSGERSLVGRLGFDRSVRLIQLWWVFGLFGFVGACLWDGAPLWVWALLFSLVVLSGRFIRALRSLKSPAGSEVERVRRQGDFYFYALISIWIAEAIWQLVP